MAYSMTLKISDFEKQLLLEILGTPSKLRVFSVDGTFCSLTKNERELIVEALTTELISKGINPDGEPNARGKAIDNLIGFFVPYDVPMHPLFGARGR